MVKLVYSVDSPGVGDDGVTDGDTTGEVVPDWTMTEVEDDETIGEEGDTTGEEDETTGEEGETTGEDEETTGEVVPDWTITEVVEFE